MDSAFVKRALEVVDEAMALDEPERSDFVKRACQHDEQLRREVESFLRYDTGVSIAPSATEELPVELPEAHSADRYELRDEIARGGMGAILRAYDEVLQREVAVKVLLEEHADNTDLMRRFVGEARVGAYLQHPGIAPVYDLGRLADGRPFFAMKLVQGETLEKLLSKRDEEQSDQPRLLAIFEQLCQTVAYAHSNSIIHRDLKPANVMVGLFGEVQVMDWGLAKKLKARPEAGGQSLEEEGGRRKAEDGETEDREYDSAPSASSLQPPVSSLSSDTRFGMTMGTPAYMSPEQSVGRRDKTTDVFALGAILCEILTGDPPYVAKSPIEVHAKSAEGNTTGAFARLDECGADAELIQLAKKCLAVSPDERLQDAQEVAGRIALYLEATQARLKSAEIAAAKAETAAREERKRRRVTVALAVTVLLIVIVGLGSWVWNRQLQTRHAEELARKERERFEREAKLAAKREFAEEEIEATLHEASQLYDKAKATARLHVEPWVRAVGALERAEALVETTAVSPDVLRDVKELAAQIRGGDAEHREFADQMLASAFPQYESEEDRRRAYEVWRKMGYSFLYRISTGSVTWKVAASAPGWRVVKPDKVTSELGAKLTRQLDDSILAGGVHHAHDTYRFTATHDMHGVTAFRLEVLPDARLPDNGPGRDETGDFRLAEFRVSLAAPDQTSTARDLEFFSSWQSYYFHGWAKEAVDGDLSTVWSVFGKMGEAHTAIFVLPEAFPEAGERRLEVTLRHGGKTGAAIGRFRLSVTREKWEDMYSEWRRVDYDPYAARNEPR